MDNPNGFRTALRGLLAVFAVAVVSLSIVAGMNYEGNIVIYAMFSLIANALLLSGFRRHALFFDTFIGVFLWLGFWMKLSVRVAFLFGEFHTPVGAFDGSGADFDRALIVSSCGMAAFMIASLVRERFFVYPKEPVDCEHTGLFSFNRAYRKLVIATFVVVVVLVAVTNIWLVIYQRGMVSQTILPFGLNGVYKWLLQFGLASASAMIIRFELKIHSNLSGVAVVVPLVEAFLSNVSLLSRGMILNASALGYGIFRHLAAMKRRVNTRLSVLAVVMLLALFIGSVFAVNFLRADDYARAQSYALGKSYSRLASLGENWAVAANMTLALFVDRWVGVEGVMAVSSSDRIGWGVWREAWQEKFRAGVPALYDRYFIDSPYLAPTMDWTRHHFVSLPGVIAFFFFPGSLLFLFISLLFVAWIAALLEMGAYRFCGRNWVLCALFGEVIAFRLASFGYVPSQSHLFFGALFLNIVIIFVAELVARKVMAIRPNSGNGPV